ncbi:tetratricopeptide repeat protein [Micromonospora sp. DH14]|uniref:tetratricopeptide repeat protein n=1 Tax=Micromonospora sp. DH14 TaxID=3040120 RepID=UPI002442B7D2|nr:tetratricopeptide repeat protein [Micromonospora sp. DH14]MDG9673901.1 tetratricopeptide repeat protein [Micromonospora sp. DH14]
MGGRALDAAGAQTPDDLAGLLRALRRRHARHQGGGELTYRQLAVRTGWSHTAIAEYLTGKTLPPTDRLDALVRLLGATPVEQGALATARDRIAERRRRAPRRPHRMVPRQLPADVATLVGRDDELAVLDTLVAAPTALVIAAISGTAGVGKTALAVHWAHRVADRFDDGQLYLNLRGFDPRGQALSTAKALHCLLGSLGVPAARVPTDLDARAALYRSALAGRRILLVLDNARDVEQLRPLLPGTPTAMVLVTSRNQLTALVGLDGAHPIPLGPLSRDAAGRLLTDRLGAQRVAAEPEAAEAIIAACARLPLALIVVAARVQQSGFRLATLATQLGTAGAHSVTDRYADALGPLETALDLYVRAGDVEGQAATWDSLGFAHHHLGQYDRAVECYERTLALTRELGDRWGEAAILSRLGDTRCALGDPTAGRADWQRALDIVTALDHPDAATVRTRLHPA